MIIFFVIMVVRVRGPCLYGHSHKILNSSRSIAEHSPAENYSGCPLLPLTPSWYPLLPSPTTRTLCSALRHRLRPITTSLIHQKITPIWCELPRPHPSKFSAPHVAGRMTFLKSVISTTKGPSHLAAATTISESAQLPISPIPAPSPTPTIP